RVFLMTNKGERDLVELVLFDLESGDEDLVERDPDDESDFAGAIFTDLTDELLATYYIGDRVRIYARDQEFAADLEFLRANLPRGDDEGRAKDAGNGPARCRPRLRLPF